MLLDVGQKSRVFKMGTIFSRCWRFCNCRNCRQSLLKKETSFSEIITGGGTNNDDPQDRGQIKQYSWDLKKKVDPSDYTIADLHCGEQNIKLPGDVNGEQLIIRNCSNAKIYILDTSSQVTIDDCSDCLIVLGPVRGSVFLRDTSNSTLVSASSQLRLRDCQNVHLFVAAESDPIIEASTDITVGPYFLSYEGIQEHFKQAKLNRFRSVKWADVYDFTPNEVTPNWRRYDRLKHHPGKYICPPQPVDQYSHLDLSFDNELASFVPVTRASDDVQLLQFYSEPRVWRKKEVVFTQEPGQEAALLLQLMDKFYMDKFVRGQTAEEQTIVLYEIHVQSNQYRFTFFQKV